MSGKAIVRVLFIVTITTFMSVMNLADLALPWHPFSTFGFSATNTGIIASVDAIGAKSGLHAGDRIDTRVLSPWDRLRVSYFSGAPFGQTLRLTLTSGRTVTLASHEYRRTTADNISNFFAVLSLFAYFIIAAVLVLIRPSPVTWAFYVFSFSLCFSGTLVFDNAPPLLLFVFQLTLFCSQPASAAAFVSFALRFPDAVPQGWGRVLEHAILFVIGPALVLWAALSVTVSIFSGPMPLPPPLLSSAIVLTGVGILLGRYATANSENRNRLQWVVAAFSVAFLPMLVIDFIEVGIGTFPEVTIINIAQAWTLLAPAALAYTILKHRLFDIRLVFSRALLYAVITSIVVGVLALVDWAIGRWLAESRFALVLELALAVGLGVLLTTVHRQLESFLNAVIFRAQTLALEALHRFALETDLIADPHHLLAQTYEALRARVESDYAAIYTLDGSSYALVTPNAPAPPLLPPHDFAVLRLRRWHEPFECDEPGHPLRAALLMPMTARAELVGFIVCGPKRDGTHYLPEEVQALSALTHRVGSAFALLTYAAETPRLRISESTPG